MKEHKNDVRDICVALLGLCFIILVLNGDVFPFIQDLFHEKAEVTTRSYILQLIDIEDSRVPAPSRNMIKELFSTHFQPKRQTILNKISFGLIGV